ncbi:odorant receptor 67d-like [Cochliomyia hominivorax]
MTTKYSTKYIKFFNFVGLFSEICGVNVTQENYHMIWITWALIALINGAIGFSFYTMYVGIRINNDLTVILQCLCMMGTGVQGYAKLINAVLRPQRFASLHREVCVFYKTFERKNQNYQKLLGESILLVQKILSVLFGVILIATNIILFTPVFYKMIFKERTFIMPFILPYIDYNTDYGYYMTSAFHVICVFFGAFGNFVSDMWCFIFAAHIPLIKNILKAKFDELDELLDNESMQISEINKALKDIVIWHQTYINYCGNITELFFWVIFVQVAMAFISIVCTIVCILLGAWPAAPAFLFYSFLLFYAYSSLGNLVEISNDDVILMIYDSCWYKLNASQQKVILFMLRESQRAENMSIGGVAPLSLNTALQLTKTIYTFSMMLRQSLNN